MRSRTSASGPSGSTWTTTSLPGKRSLHGGLDPIGGRMPLLDRGARRHADDDVDERASGGVAKPQPAQLHRRLEREDRAARGS